MIRGRVSRRALVVLLAVAGLTVAACGSEPDPHAPAVEATGAATVVIRTSDGLALDARLWDVPGWPIAIYLHEYREDQDSWWPESLRRTDVAALTFDFRGHGASQGDEEDIHGMVLDVRAAVEFARQRGYREITIVGAGMGATAGLIVAADEPDVAVIGLSAPAEFGGLEPLAVIPDVSDRVALVAAEADLSAAHSLEAFREAGVPEARVRLYPGRAHGIEMLGTPGNDGVRAYLDSVMAEFNGRAGG